MSSQAENAIVKDISIPGLASICIHARGLHVELTDIILKDHLTIPCDFQWPVVSFFPNRQDVPIQEGTTSCEAHQAALASLGKCLEVYELTFHQPLHHVAHESGLGTIKGNEMRVAECRTQAGSLLLVLFEVGAVTAGSHLVLQLCHHRRHLQPQGLELVRNWVGRSCLRKGAGLRLHQQDTWSFALLCASCTRLGRLSSHH
mmetsp:Transcript_118243/g.166210  ORF Transcript_118243/g.166210 Transcript_118243/m.166210 type:complete len:202 (+) Transcript_118243:1255-1860(+)